MIFRAFFGEPRARRRSSRDGPPARAEPTNPATGEVEDTDVGFPGPEHHIAERALPMKLAMGMLAVLATIGGVVQIPKTTTWLDTFLEPTFAESTVGPSTRPTALLVLRPRARRGPRRCWASRSPTGSGSRRTARSPPRLQERFAAAAPALRQQVVLRRAHRLRGRPAVRAGSAASASRPSSASSSTARWSAAPPASCAPGSAAVRALQSGFLRAYAALLLARRRPPSSSTSWSRPS